MAPIRWMVRMALGNGFSVVQHRRRRSANITWIQLNQSGLGAIRVKPEEEDIGSHDMENFPILSPQSSRCCSLSPPGTYIVPTTSLSCRKQAKRQWQRADDDATLNDTDYIILLMLAGVREDVSDDREHAALLKTSAQSMEWGRRRKHQKQVSNAVTLLLVHLITRCIRSQWARWQHEWPLLISSSRFCCLSPILFPSHGLWLRLGRDEVKCERGSVPV